MRLYKVRDVVNLQRSSCGTLSYFVLSLMSVCFPGYHKGIPGALSAERPGSGKMTCHKHVKGRFPGPKLALRKPKTAPGNPRPVRA